MSSEPPPWMVPSSFATKLPAAAIGWLLLSKPETWKANGPLSREFTIVTLALPAQFGESMLDVACTENDASLGRTPGAVYSPVFTLTDPQSLEGQSAIAQVTVCGAASGVTGAENCCCRSSPIIAGPGTTVTVMGSTVRGYESDLVVFATDVAVMSTIAGFDGIAV